MWVICWSQKSVQKSPKPLTGNQNMSKQYELIINIVFSIQFCNKGQWSTTLLERFNCGERSPTVLYQEPKSSLQLSQNHDHMPESHTTWQEPLTVVPISLCGCTNPWKDILHQLTQFLHYITSSMEKGSHAISKTGSTCDWSDLISKFIYLPHCHLVLSHSAGQQ